MTINRKAAYVAKVGDDRFLIALSEPTKESEWIVVNSRAAFSSGKKNFYIVAYSNLYDLQFPVYAINEDQTVTVINEVEEIWQLENKLEPMTMRLLVRLFPL